MKKTLFAFAAAAVLSLCAKDVDLFELKLANGKTNFASSWNHEKYLKIEIKPYSGAKAAIVVTPANPAKTVDTAFRFDTPVLNVEGKKVLKIEVKTLCTQDLTKIAGGCATAVIWDPGKTQKVQKFTFAGGKTDFVEAKKTLAIPAGTKKAVVRIGFDTPNLTGKDVFALKDLEVEAE